ncbi:DUF4233 domain-containing protein [Streptomyces sp. DSM 44917]|uniref:DUF4233 domain-containing protein n=1 Tax=Streptomyces boetiae TaxID=3075541 RepID=A0ABU2L7P5_9ACTN|nr:DUF4233 domain-containing protein [Streptomyces sp. DSM 44917]MDT0307600.1 DUF4233 domain-containing protein [Streptomyces sp. DSM 44917]
MRTLCASTLTFECVVIGLAGLVAMRMTDLSNGVIWAVSGTGMLLCLALCGMLTRPGAVPLGWALQAALVAAGFVIPAMFLLGAAFAGLWWASVHYGRLIDRLKAARAVPAEPSPGTL